MRFGLILIVFLFISCGSDMKKDIIGTWELKRIEIVDCIRKDCGLMKGYYGMMKGRRVIYREDGTAQNVGANGSFQYRIEIKDSLLISNNEKLKIKKLSSFEMTLKEKGWQASAIEYYEKID